MLAALTLLGFRGGNVAAPLKPDGAGEHGEILERFRGGNVAAPLKHSLRKAKP